MKRMSKGKEAMNKGKNAISYRKENPASNSCH